MALNQSFTIDEQEIDRKYTLEALMTGYVGVGGFIDGVLNPLLRAEEGEVVKITIINGELMPHDIVMEVHDVASEIIIEEGATTSIVFTARVSDTYFCSIPGHRQAGMEGSFEVVDELIEEVIVEGYLPEQDGRPLNVNFEAGTLQDWMVEDGEFDGQFVIQEPSPFHGEDVHLNATGEYFFSSGGAENHDATGVLRSVAFQVTAPYASFYVSGGALQETRVELVEAESERVLFKITGNNHATLRPVVVDLGDYIGEAIFIRIVDNETGVSEIPYIRGNILAHVNFDNFQFHQERPDYPNELRPEDIIILPARDLIPNAGLSGEDAVKEMKLPDGFSVTLAVSEPDLVRPIGFAMDERGRLWVAEGNTYPVRAPEGEGKDRILILEDTNGDGRLDNQTVFMDGLNLVSGIEVGFGGVWVGAAPYLLFIPVNEQGDAPAGDPEILLDGWGYQDTHETLNSFQWGPDGWLYGVHGVFTHSNVGRPGDSDEERQRINAGIWRYHPTAHKFEVYAHGTSNPWGIDFNDVGHAFTTVCVIPHLFHVIQGARYHRQSGQHFNPYTYDDIKTIADHVHYVGDRGPHAGNFRSGDAGGGHAHAGAMFYLGNDHWGQDRDAIFMNNIHGYRLNTDRIQREGSGYSAIHGEDFLLTNDSWSQWLNFRYGPDGSVFAIDWYDKNQCHSSNPDVHEKTLGRIYKIHHEQDEFVKVDLSTKSNMELVELQLHENDWYVRHARRLLQQRGADGSAHAALTRILDEHPEIPRKLRVLWALHVTDGLTEAKLLDLLDHESEYVRGWSVKLLTEDREVSDRVMTKFTDMARHDDSALVRLYLASATQRVENQLPWGILEGLSQKGEDAEDHNLPLMVWYGLEPMVESDMEKAIEIASKSALPNLLSYTIQRIAAMGTEVALETLERLQERIEDEDVYYIIQSGIDNINSRGL